MSNTTLKEVCKQAWGYTHKLKGTNQMDGCAINKQAFRIPFTNIEVPVPNCLKFPTSGNNYVSYDSVAPVTPTAPTHSDVAKDYTAKTMAAETPSQTDAREKKETEKLVQTGKTINQVRKDAINVNNLKNTPRNMLALVADAANKAISGVEDLGASTAYIAGMTEDAVINGVNRVFKTNFPSSVLRAAAAYDQRRLANQAARTNFVDRMYGSNIHPRVADPWSLGLAAYATWRAMPMAKILPGGLKVARPTMFPILSPASTKTTQFMLGNIPDTASVLLPFIQTGAGAYVKANKDRFLPDKGKSKPWYAGEAYNVINRLVDLGMLDPETPAEEWDKIMRANWPKGVPIPLKLDKEWYNDYTNELINNNIPSELLIEDTNGSDLEVKPL